MPLHAVQEPIAAPRSSCGKTETMMASAAGVSSAPATPCRPRATMSTPTVGARAQASEKTPKSATPATKIRRSPKMSASEPATRMSDASVSR